MAKNAILDRLLALTPKPVEIDVPDLGKVHVRGMTGAEREAWEKATYDDAGNPRVAGGVRAGLVAAGLCDANGVMQLTPDNAAALSAVRSDVLQKIAEKVADLNGIGKDKLEEKAKNSSSGTNASSS